MSKLVHQLYISTLVGIVLITAVFLFYKGIPYYSTSLEERFYHPDHDLFKPSGLLGHGLGIIGTLLILIGVFGYIARKRYKFLSRFGRLKYWLEFHIFLCTLGPVLILFHTAFKFGGIVSISFWSMVAVVLSGVIGRFIYIQIPRTIEGRELTLHEVQKLKSDLGEILNEKQSLDETSHAIILESVSADNRIKEGNFFVRNMSRYMEDKGKVRSVRRTLKNNNVAGNEIREIVKIVKNEISINNKIERLQTMQNLFKYWHVAHLPFAIIMLIIMVVHVAVTLAFGYKWIF